MLLPSGELRPPPLSLQPPPPLLFPVTTCKLKSNLSVSPPTLHAQASARPPPGPTPPHPASGPQLQEALAECNSLHPPLHPGPVRTD